MPRLALYPGTFDPVTLGHLDVLRRALRLFDRVEVTVAVNASKRTLFSGEERVALIHESVADWTGDERARLDVVVFEGLVAARAAELGAVALVRGIRQVTDFDYELRMAIANQRLNGEAVTVFLTPSDEHAFTSSSLVREIHRFGGDVSSFVPEPVLARLRERSALRARGE
jgi:pantetheine-phosphate adenylyltransferase